MDLVNSTILNVTNNATSTNITSAGSIFASSVLFVLAIVPIYFGSLLSQKCLDKAKMEVVTWNDAATFPIYASGALFGIYLLFKFLPQDYINFLVTLHFSIIGVCSMAHCFCPYFRKFVPPFITNHSFKLEFTRSEIADTENQPNSGDKVLDHHCLSFVTKDFLGFAIAVFVGAWYFFTKHWLANNFVAITICIMAIEYIRLNKFANGFLLLGGLFFYDIFWVFGTPVMVSVAKSLDAPIKVTFPRDFLVNGIFGKEQALLGLGDIVVPGIFVAMLLRFDQSLNRNGSRTYFHTGYLAYIVGLLMTFIVMHTFNAAQPALLYLVPTCLGFPTLLALVRHDFQKMLSYEDVPDGTDQMQVETEKNK